jgi:thiamine-phosphate pyrophosphorylase
VFETPTKPGRPAAGLDLISYAAEHVDLPWFAIGGIDESNLAEVMDAGARRIVVVRAITEASDPVSAAARLRSLLDEVAL